MPLVRLSILYTNQKITNDETKSLKKNLEKINKIEKIEKKLMKYV